MLSSFSTGSGDLPSVKILREKYVPLLKEDRAASVRQEVCGKPVSILADETTDKRGKCVFVVLFRLLEPSDTQKIFVAGVHFLEQANATTCARAVLDSMKEYNVNYDSVVAFVSDSARYMTKCSASLQVVLGDHMLHIQCWAHKLNIIGSICPKVLTELNTAISKIKSSFLNTRKRKHLYTKFLTNKYPNGEKNICQFPMPVLTRWNSWFQSVIYTSQYISDLIDFFASEDMRDVPNAGIEYFNSLSDIDTKKIEVQATFVKEHLNSLMKLTEHLEASKCATSHTLVNKLTIVKEDLSVAASGIFNRETDAALKTITNKIGQAEVKNTLQRAASLSMDKLQLLMSTDPSQKFFYCVGKLFDPSKVLLNEVNDELIEMFMTLPGVTNDNLSSADIARGYTRMKEIVKERTQSSKAEIVEILFSMKNEFPDFACVSLKCVWIPCSNVDSERFFSSYNTVVSDRRHNLLDQNAELMTTLAFEQCE